MKKILSYAAVLLGLMAFSSCQKEGINPVQEGQVKATFSISVPQEAVTKALKDVDYKGEMTLEADTYLKAFNAENIEEGIKNMADAARKLVDMVENA